jgi:glycosyltransferase involved in cell wall biosynthesis
MDVFVMPSLWEGGPITVLEAMAMARRVVATCVGMVPEVIVPGEDGLVVSPGSAAELAEAVRQLIEAPEAAAAMGERARETALAGFSPDVMIGRVSAIYDAALGKRLDI